MRGQEDGRAAQSQLGQQVEVEGGRQQAQEHEGPDHADDGVVKLSELLAEGLSNEEIAERLVISHHTVARHRENLMRKLGLHNRSELVKYAIRKGMIAP